MELLIVDNRLRSALRGHLRVSVHAAGRGRWERLADEFAGAQLLSSALLALESERTLVYLSRSGRLAPSDLQNALDRLGQDLDHFALRDPTLDLCRSRLLPIVSTPRSPDLAHLR